MQFFDSVETGHEELSKTARQIFQHCQTVAVLKAGALPASAFCQGWHQRDEWSCGFHAARILEVRRRQLRGELPAPVLDVASYLAHTRELVAKLQALQAKYKKVPWPPEKPARAPEVSKDTDPGDKSEAGQEKEEDPGDKDPDAAGKDCWSREASRRLWPGPSSAPLASPARPAPSRAARAARNAWASISRPCGPGQSRRSKRIIRHCLQRQRDIAGFAKMNQ